MSRVGAAGIGLTPDQYNSSLNSTSTSGYSSQYSSSVSGQFSGQTSPSRQYSPMHYASTQYIAVPCSVKSTPVCQADVSHEIIRPTPRRPGAPSPGLPSRGAVSPIRGTSASPHQYNGFGSSSSSYPLHSSSPSLVSSPQQQLTIPISGRASESPSRALPLAPAAAGRSSSSARQTPVRADLDFSKPPMNNNGCREAFETSTMSNTSTSSLKESRASASDKLLVDDKVTLASPYWCGVGSQDPMSRQFEYPERDVPITTAAAGLTTSSIRSNGVVGGSGGGGREVGGVTAVTVEADASKSLHVTNLLIDRSANSSLNLPVPYQSFSKDEGDDDSGTEEHPAVRQGRSSLIKYKANNKAKPKRKFVNHLSYGRDKLKRHEHVKQEQHRQTGRDKLNKHPNGDFAKGLEKANQLLEVKAALEQLTFGKVGNQLHSSTSTFSSMSECESDADSADLVEVQERGERNGKYRASSQETLSTTVTSADEFVWIDSHNRLVEIQQVPWSGSDFMKVIQLGTLRESAQNISSEVFPRLSYYLQRALVRIAREAQRLSQKVHKCSKHEIMTALKIVLSPVLASSCIKACLRAGAMYNISSDHGRQTKSARAGLHLDIGKFHQWMCSVRVGKFIQEYAAVYMAAGLENILEEVLAQCIHTGSQVTVQVLELCISNSADLWGLFQPYAHLSSCRTAKGTLVVPRCLTFSSSDTVRLTSTVKSTEKSLSQILLTTCVGSKEELEALISAVGQFYQKYYHPLISSNNGRGQPSWNRDSLQSLFHYMRCSQLEYQAQDLQSSIQELVYERPYMVLPPLIEWFRVTVVFCESRLSSTIESDDVFQAARVLLPGADYPPLGQAFNQQFYSFPSSNGDEADFINSTKRNTAFQMLLSGRKDLVPHALSLLPASKINTANDQGLTPLMIACLREDFPTVKMLIDVGAALDYRTTGSEKWHTQVNPELLHWTPLHYATMTGNYDICRLLLEKGANVEGHVDVEDDICTETPLQLASAAGKVEIVELLLSFGSSPFLSTLKVDSMSFGSSAQKGCYSALSTAASHGQRKCLHKLVTHPSTLTSQHSGKEVLSLEEILAEGVSSSNLDDKSSDSKKIQKGNLYSRFTKPNVKRLQEAMFHSTESGNIDITLDLRNFGVPWTLHSWIRTLITSHQAGLSSISDELLQDFSRDWTEDNSAYFIDDCLPVLFSLFKTSKIEGTILLLADVLSSSYGKDPIEKIEYSEKLSDLQGAPRIDPKFVNNPELSDIQFRVEGQIFYAHKLVLITSSYKFRTMLNSKFCEGNPPVLQINDIRYEIFEMVMQYLYKGSADFLVVEQGDILELMAAANFFQLDGLLHFCEVRCADLIDLDTIVSYYIHAKVYSAGQLLVYAEGFLLQNLVALLTYDDSVKRLIFGKKLQNHDVISGLLKTLQDRIRKRGQNKSKKLSL